MDVRICMEIDYLTQLLQFAIIPYNGMKFHYME